MAIQGLLRVIVYVEDMQKQVAFYRDILQLALNYPQQDDYSDAFWVEFQAGAATIALHAGGKAGNKPSAPKFVFAVQDIHAEHARLRAAGVKLSNVETVAPNVLSADAWDAEGNIFSIDEHLHES